MEERLDLKNLKGTWTIIKGKVYDVSNFSDHPGGFEVFTDCKGKNATEDYINAKHPDYVEEDMKKFYIGEVPKIHQDEVSKHNKEGDIWMGIHGKVYDVSHFNTHPGGEEILLLNSGNDATNAFDDIDHTEGAKKDLEKYYIGEYVPGETQAVEKKSNFLIYFALVAIAIAVLLRNYFL